MTGLQDQSWAPMYTDEILLLLYEIRESGMVVKPHSILHTLEMKYETPPSPPTVYRVLDKLQERDMVEEYKAKRYAITEKGAQVVEEYVEPQHDIQQASACC